MITCNAIASEITTGVKPVTVFRATLTDVERALENSYAHKGAKSPYRIGSCSQGSSSDWYGNYTLHQFHKLVRDGDATLVTDVLSDLDLAIADNADAFTVTRAPAGFHPCVPAYLSGQPDAMYTLRIEATPRRKSVTLFYNVGFSGGTRAADVLEYGQHVMRIVNQLHAERVDVTLYGYVYNTGAPVSGHRVLTVIEIQRSENVFAPERIAATLPASFCRRGVFGLWEHIAFEQGNEVAKYLVNNCYGTHTVELELTDLQAAMHDMELDSIVLLPEVGRHVNPSKLWEPINMKLKRSTQA